MSEKATPFPGTFRSFAAEKRKMGDGDTGSAEPRVEGGRSVTFYEKMRIVCMAIPAGKVATYGQIAMLCGKPGNSRQVGYGLKNDLAGPDVPAFRIVNGKGELSGACHFQIPGLQQRLLEDDGIEVHWNGNHWCVDLKKYGWKSSLEDAHAFLREFELSEK